ncbi:MAG TPA: hypothetical protein VJA25_15670 [Dehalococcoidia bacterium]|nr:hypothetical protein [Dehalococcoidia bacterium]
MRETGVEVVQDRPVGMVAMSGFSARQAGTPAEARPEGMFLW